MPWRTITPEIADSLLGARELAVIQDHAGIDIREDVLRRIIAKVRGYCGGAGPLGEDGTVPPECESAVASLYRYDLLAMLPVGNLLTEARGKERESAEAFLKMVAKGEVAVSRPDNVTVSSADLTGPGSVSPTISAPARRRHRSGLDGS